MKRPPEIYTADEVGRLMGVCSNSAPTGIRNQALIGVLYRTGLRINEALELRPRDVEFGTGRVTVRAGKGNKYSDGPVVRIVGIDKFALGLLARWLDRRQRRGINGQQPIFCTIQGGKMAGQYVRSLFARLGVRAGIEKRIHAHGFRHSFACELLQEGVDLATIARQLGHKRISTTDAYLRWLRPDLDVITRREFNGTGTAGTRAGEISDSISQAEAGVIRLDNQQVA
ncbi:MAG: tyrosine-type recombinase/integrase [Planctomycetota bacterium]|jgi:site-specific recombinase XerD